MPAPISAEPLTQLQRWPSAIRRGANPQERLEAPRMPPAKAAAVRQSAPDMPPEANSQGRRGDCSLRLQNLATLVEEARDLLRHPLGPTALAHLRNDLGAVETALARVIENAAARGGMVALT